MCREAAGSPAFHVGLTFYGDEESVETLALREGRSSEAIYKMLQRIRRGLQECIERGIRAETNAAGLRRRHHDLLFARVCDGLATAEEIATFHRLLRTDADALDAWVHYSELHGELGAGMYWLRPPGPRQVTPCNVSVRRDDRAAPRLVRPRSWLQWAPQAAAGLAVGLFAASIVWAYVGPPALRTRSLLNEDFESSEVSLVARTVLETGVWRGDAAEIVGAQRT